jgi:hypothetical protein
MEEMEIEETYNSSAQCINNFNNMYCGGLCSPYQSSFLEIITVGPNSTYNSTNNATTDVTVLWICEEFCQRLFSSCGDVELIGGMTVNEVYVGDYETFCKAVGLFDFDIRLRNYSCYTDQEAETNPETSCLSYGEGLYGNPRAGVTTSFIIQSSDIFGQNKTVGGDNWLVEIGNGYFPNIIDNNDGTYYVEYTIFDIGEILINITLNGRHLCGSPFQVNILPGTD